MRKVMLICIAVFSLIVYCDLVSAGMTGTWNVERIDTSKLKMKGTATQTEVKSMTDIWHFDGDGSFVADHFAGSWSQRGASFSVLADFGPIESFIEEVLLPGKGLIVTVTKAKVSGSEKKDGTSKGTYLIQATVVGGEGKTGTLTVNGKFQGLLPYASADYFPLNQGNTWTYKRTGERDGEPFEDNHETQTIDGTKAVGRVVYAKKVEDDGDYTLFSNTNGVQVAEDYEIGNDGGSSVETVDTFKPPLQYMPSRFSVGTIHTFKSVLNHKDSSGVKAAAKIELQTIVEGIEDISVAAGDFNDCVRVRMIRNLSAPKLNTSETSDTTTWLAKGVGIVKEISTTVQDSNGQVETETETDELISTNLGL